LNDARPKVLFTVDEKLDDLGDRSDHPYLEKTISPSGDIPYGGLLEIRSYSFKAVDQDRKSTAAILYTGGTTGIPNEVMLTHENIKSSVHNVCHFERSNQGDRALCLLPPNHIFAQIHIMNSMVYVGGSLVIQPSFDLDKVLEAIRRHQITKF
jgi:long-chain acyl-CoA synthetase